MAVEKYKTLLFILCTLCCVVCELGLPEGASCFTQGFNGTCVELGRCTSAYKTNIFLTAGFRKSKFPELPDICSYKDKKIPVVCCTDCDIRKGNETLSGVVLPDGRITSTDGTVAWKKCLEYFQRLPYKCRGYKKFGVSKTWIKERKCHETITTGASFWTSDPFFIRRNAKRWESPHTALIGYGEDVESAKWLCVGSVISERFILTAAHCAASVTLGSIKFAALGLLKRTDPKKYWKIHNIKRIINHPEYKPPSKYHDIALLETETEMNFGRNLLPACLDTGKQGKNGAEAVGWGRLGHRQALADTLQVIDLRQFNDSDCAQMYKRHRLSAHGYDHKTQMCYGRRREIIDTCEGDSGGPLQIHELECLYTIVGVTSYGKNCGILGSAGMYTKVSYYVPWIESIVWPEEHEELKKIDNEWIDKWLS